MVELVDNEIMRPMFKLFGVVKDDRVKASPIYKMYYKSTRKRGTAVSKILIWVHCCRTRMTFGRKSNRISNVRIFLVRCPLSLRTNTSWSIAIKPELELMASKILYFKIECILTIEKLFSNTFFKMKYFQPKGVVKIL